MNRFAFVLLALLPMGPPEKVPVPVPLEIAGYYSLVSEDNRVVGVVAVSKAPSGDYLFQYMTRGDPVQTVGVGLRLPRDSNTVSVGWRHRDAVGVTRFQVEADAAGKPKLVGKWSNLTLSGEETLTWLRAVE